MNFSLLKKRSKKFGFLKLIFLNPMIVLENGSSIGNLLISRVKHSNDFLNDYYFIAEIIGQVLIKLFQAPRLFQGKDKTFCIKQNNTQHRHWFARFRRKTLANTR
ncbi:hypothetical protein HE1_01104 [Holospora elegans E1]|uniref:Uncharacterized protein n=1 Tax=Holospora elegans E1 TaxID=1427503 RepID=A0A023E036_9PROT|nr:IS1 transposase [Holospora elegans]GAJ46765.1 hypothetical protein HE1_01104 [Holospora elegans E1]